MISLLHYNLKQKNIFLSIELIVVQLSPGLNQSNHAIEMIVKKQKFSLVNVKTSLISIVF